MVNLEPRFCYQCGNPVEQGDQFCEQCGSAIRRPSGQAQAEEVAPPPNPAPSVSEHAHPKSQWESVFGEGGAAQKTIAEQERRHEAIFGPPRSAPASSRPSLPGARTNGTAVASLVLALVGVLIGSILAIVLGHQAQREIDMSEGTQTGRGLATAGIVLGWISLSAWALIILVAVASSN